MHKKIILSTLLASSTFLFGNSSIENEKLQILSNDLKTKDNVIVATGNVVIFSPTYYISANKVIYNKNKETLELFDDVFILKDNTTQTQSDYAFLDLNEKTVIQNPIMIIEKKSNLWITSNDASKKGNKYNFEDSILSSCDCIDPAWNIKFSSADYDAEDEWLNTYNSRLYFKDVPLFYTPYLGFSTNTKRRTGLLIPTAGYSNGEGFLFSQPIYFAPEDNYDLEIIPQIRSDRGFGIYSYFRYIDSEYSKLDIKSGYFREKNSYVIKNSLENSAHFGWSVDYERSKLFSDDDTEDGLFASINWLNDIEFYNLEDSKYYQTTEKKVESKINYYYENNDYFLGTYLRHYIDTSVSSNDSTLQQEPQIQLHTYKDSLFLDKLLYSTDLQFTNYEKVTGIKATKADFIVPLSYGFSFFDDYLNLTFKEEFQITKLNYTNETTRFKNATFIENRHVVSIDSDLLKTYDSGIHTLKLSSDFIIPETLKKDGDIYGITNNNAELAEFPISETDKVLTFTINQAWTSIEDLEEIIRHKIKQSIVYDDFNNQKLGNLENEISFNYGFGTIENRIQYSHLDNELVESSSNFTLDYENYFLNLTHYKSKNTTNSGLEELSSYGVKAGFSFNKDYKISYLENYNIKEKVRNRQGFVFEINDRCWSLNLNLEKEVVPSSSTTSSSIRQDVVYVQLILKPLGGIKQAYKVKGD